MLSSAACLPACLSDQWSKRTVVRPGLRLSCCSSLRGFLRSQGPESCKNVVPEKGGSRGPRVQELSKSQAGCVSLGPSSCSLAAWPEARRQTQREREEEKGETQLGSPRRQTGSQPQTELAFLESRTPIASFCLLPFALCLFRPFTLVIILIYSQSNGLAPGRQRDLTPSWPSSALPSAF